MILCMVLLPRNRNMDQLSGLCPVSGVSEGLRWAGLEDDWGGGLLPRSGSAGMAQGEPSLPCMVGWI